MTVEYSTPEATKIVREKRSFYFSKENYQPSQHLPPKKVIRDIIDQVGLQGEIESRGLWHSIYSYISPDGKTVVEFTRAGLPFLTANVRLDVMGYNEGRKNISDGNGRTVKTALGTLDILEVKLKTAVKTRTQFHLTACMH
jgi:hypothetical protein